MKAIKLKTFIFAFFFLQSCYLHSFDGDRTIDQNDDISKTEKLGQYIENQPRFSLDEVKPYLRFGVKLLMELTQILAIHGNALAARGK